MGFILDLWEYRHDKLLQPIARSRAPVEQRWALKPAQ
jgi:hypothetical protein